MRIEVVSATRHVEMRFWKASALGQSLQRLAHDARLVPVITFSNKRGLSEIYNERIDVSDADVLVLVHDDVWIDDYFLADRILSGLQSYDVIGVAGNKRCDPDQPAWAFKNAKFEWDDKQNLSGAVAHGPSPFGHVSSYGAVPASCELLDGVFLALNKKKVSKSGARFDPRFDFHFYDMDFCRTARARGLFLGTWPICLTHQSGGAFGTPSWTRAHQAYAEKWSACATEALR